MFHRIRSYFVHGIVTFVTVCLLLGIGNHWSKWYKNIHEPIYEPINELYEDKLKMECLRVNSSLRTETPQDHTPLPFLIGSSGTPVCSGDIFMLCIVKSAPSNYARRELIRQTWASVVNIEGDRMATIFVLGRSTNANESGLLSDESDRRADIVQGDFIDSYKNLTYKDLYAFRWIKERCQSVKFVISLDDDVVLNVYLLRELLYKQKKYMTGDFFYCPGTQGYPIREPGSKWFVSEVEWPDETYPAYCLGFGYVMTGTLIPRLHYCAKWRRFFWIDDVFISGVLANGLSVPRIRWETNYSSYNPNPNHTGTEVKHLVLVYAGSNQVLPNLHTQIWRAMVKYCGID